MSLPALNGAFPRDRGIYRARLEALALLGFFALAVVFAAAAFFRVEEALVGVAVAVELAFCEQPAWAFSQLEPKFPTA